MRIELEAAISERDSLAKRVIRIEESIDNEVTEKVLLEREKIKILEKKMEKLQSRLSEEVLKNQEVDTQIQKFSQEVDELANWKTVYESGHGMQELARYQKKLKEDNRRLTTAIEQTTNKLGMAVDMNNILSQSFDRLKLECGKSPDFFYPEYDIQKEFLSENNRLKAEAKISEEQISSLEEDCIRLRKTLKNHAGTYSEQGFKYSGMTAEQLTMVNEFASNLRHGSVELPLNDRSNELLKENKKLREDFSVFQIKIERYEREFGTLNSNNNNNNNEMDSSANFELIGLRNDVQRLVQENRELQDRVMEMKNDLNISFNNNDSKLLYHNKHPNNINRSGGTSSNGNLHQPYTTRGQQFVQSNILQLNLPPEEWSDDFKRLHAQLIECVEQLFEKEQELIENQNIIKNIENTLVQVKQHTASLYYDFSMKSSTWEQREKQYKQENLDLRNECDDMKTKLKRIQEVIDVIQKDDKNSMEAKLSELNRKVIIYEVNESILSRKYTSLAEQLHLEQQVKVQLEFDFADMESTLKKRILYLEQYKSAVSNRLALLQARLNKSVPVDDFTNVLSEVEALREDNLQIIRREVESRIATFKMHEQQEELRQAKNEMMTLQLDLYKYEKSVEQLSIQLEHEKTLCQRIIAINQSASSSSNLNQDLSTIVSEMATYRGESSRLEVELLSNKKKLMLLQQQLELTTNESQSLESRVKELESREEEVNQRENDARKIAYELKNMYDGGLTSEDSEKLKNDFIKCSYDLDAAVQESLRQKELAEIASLQAQSINSFKQQHLDELRELQDICLKLESRTDDDLLIGKMQRQLMSTKSSYKLFSRKYQLLRGNMRQRELALRALETRLDQREVAVLSMQENYHMEITAVKKALRSLTEMVFDKHTNNNNSSTTNADTDNDTHDGKLLSPFILLKSKTDEVVNLNKKLSLVSEKVNQLAVMAEKALNRLSQAESETNIQKALAEDLQIEKNILIQKCTDLQTITQGKKKQSTIASRIISLSEEVKTLKLSSLQHKRKIETLQFEKRHFQNIINGMEVNVENLEQVHVTAETWNLLGTAALRGNNGQNPEELYDLDDSDILDDDDDDSNINMRTNNNNHRNYINPSDDHLVDKIYNSEHNARESQIQRELRKSADGNKQQQVRASTTSISGNGGGATGLSASELKSLTSDEIMLRIQNLTKQLITTRKDYSELKLLHNHILSRCADMEALIDEKNHKLAYCERLFIQEGLPAPFGQEGSYDESTFDFHNNNNKPALHHMQIEQGKLQEAASATIGSLRSLLDEKNKQLEKYRDRIEELQRDTRVKSKADLKAEELLNHLNQEEEYQQQIMNDNDNTNHPYRRHNKNFDISETGAYLKKEKLNTKLLDQIDQADEIMKDKVLIINQLEEKLAAEYSQRERAEIRCGAALEEMEAMKQDMITLVKKLQANEEKYNISFADHDFPNDGDDEDLDQFILPPSPHAEAKEQQQQLAESRVNIPQQQPNEELVNRFAFRLKQQKLLNTQSQKRILELQNVLKSKDTKMRQYRDVIVKLKEEFIKSEEENAMAVVTATSTAMNKKSGSNHGGGGEMIMVNADELRELKGQVSDLREGLNQAKTDLDKARRIRDKIIQSKHAMQDDVSTNIILYNIILLWYLNINLILILLLLCFIYDDNSFVR